MCLFMHICAWVCMSAHVHPHTHEIIETHRTDGENWIAHTITWWHGNCTGSRGSTILTDPLFYFFFSWVTLDAFPCGSSMRRQIFIEILFFKTSLWNVYFYFFLLPGHPRLSAWVTCMLASFFRKKYIIS